MNQKLTSTISKVELNKIAQNLNDTIKKQNNYVYECFLKKERECICLKSSFSECRSKREKS
jgi:hypothetical protein